MSKRRAVVPRLESMEDRAVPSPLGSHLIHSASVELHRLGKNLDKTYHTIRHNLQAQSTTHAHHAAKSPSGFQSFIDSIKSAFKF
jgi:hypothetical protein